MAFGLNDISDFVEDPLGETKEAVEQAVDVVGDPLSDFFGTGPQESKSETQTTAEQITESARTETATQEQIAEAISQQQSQTVSEQLGQTQQATTGSQTTTQQAAAQTQAATDTARQASEILRTETLSAPTRAIVESLLGNIQGGIDVDPIVEEARQRSEADIARSATALATATGSSQNSIVQQMRAENVRDNEVQLAALTAELNLRERESAVAGTAQLAEVLKGAVTTGSAETTETTTAQELSNVIENLTGETLSEEDQQTVTQLSEVLNQLVDVSQSSTSTTASEAEIAVDEIINSLSDTLFKGTQPGASPFQVVTEGVKAGASLLGAV